MQLKRLLLFCILILFTESVSGSAWDSLLVKKTGEVDIFYYPTEPFIFKNKAGELAGIEKELIESFFNFVEKEYHIKILKNWIELDDFDLVLSNVSSSKNAFGISLISQTSARKKRVNFSDAYMPDISVLITNIAVPILKDSAKVEILKDFKAVTVNNTTYESDLRSLSAYFDLNLQLINVADEANIIKLVSENKRMLGYVGLPFYVIEIGKGKAVKRQGAFQVKRDGYRFIYNKNSSWDVSVQAYFESFFYKSEVDNIIRKYLGNEYSELIWGIGEENGSSRNTEIDFLNREKEIQSKSLFESQQQKEVQGLVIIAVSIGLLFVVVIAILLIIINKKKSKLNNVLTDKGRELETLLAQLNEQKDEIGYQRKLLQKKNEQLIKINRQKDDLIGIVAHDLKSPINQMTGLISLLGYKADGWSGEEKQLFEKLQLANGHLKQLVERILDLEAIKEDSLNYDITKVDWVEVVKDVVYDFEEMAERKKIEIKLKGLNKRFYIMADSFFLKQVFENLISNAIKFSPLCSKIEIIAETFANEYRISVKDRGPGISKADQNKLFTKYQTLSAKPTANESSTGLGLSIVKKYVNEMKGSVWSESTEGKGATFIVAFPRIK